MDALVDPQYRIPDGSALRIWRDTAQNKFLSEQNGRAIFDEVIYAEVISPGSRDSTPIFEIKRVFAEEMHRDEPKYGVKYEEYKQYVDDFEKGEKHDATLAGTPLSQWSEMTRTMVASLKVQSIFTVEALASLPDSRLGVVGPDGRTWREKAKAYVESAKNASYATELAAKVENLETDLAAAKDREKELAERVKELEATASKSGSGSSKPPVPPPTSKPPADII